LKDFPTMAKKPAEQIVEAAAEAVSKGGEAAEKIVKGNAEALTKSGNASRAAIQALTKAYQELAAKNAKNLTAAMQALAAVKSPAEFMELQQRLIKEGVDAAVSDSLAGVDAAPVWSPRTGAPFALSPRANPCGFRDNRPPIPI
jgi:hypothetical protein